MGDVFAFQWKERGGPPVTRPTSQGFGSRLINSTLSSWGEVAMEYERQGFRLDFKGSLDKLTHSVVPDFEFPMDGAAIYG